MAKQETKTNTDSKRGKGRNPIPENETANQRTVRLLNMRMPNALKQLHLIENCFTGSQYQWTAEQSAQVIAALSDAIASIQQKAENSGKVDKANVFHINPID